MFKPICWPIISPAHWAAMKSKLDDHAHRQAEDHFAADADGQLPSVVSGSGDRRDARRRSPNASTSASSTFTRRGIRELPNSGANEHHPGQPEERPARTPGRS